MIFYVLKHPQFQNCNKGTDLALFVKNFVFTKLLWKNLLDNW